MAALPPGIRKIILANGEIRYEILKSYKDHRIHERYRTLEQAKNRLKEWMEEVESGRLFLRRITLEELAGEWLEHKRTRLAAHTFRDYTYILRDKILPRLGHLEAAQIQPMVIQTFINEIERSAPRTANKTLTVLRQIYRYGIQWGYCAFNPAASVDRAAYKRPTVDVLNEEEAARLLAAAQGLDLAIISLALGCGLRKGEVFALRWGDVDWMRGILTVSRSRGMDGQIKETKTGRVRTVVLPDWVRDNLAAYYQDQGRPSPENWLFPGERETMDPSNWHKKFRDLLRAAGIRQVTFHSLRHTFASLLLAQGVDPLYVSRQLGHSTIVITMDTYGHLLPGGQDYRDKLNALFRSAQNLHKEQSEQK